MLGVVRVPNEYLKIGTWVECFDDGCREVEVETVDKKLQVVREVGFLLPRDKIVPLLLRPGKRGLHRNG